MNPPGISIASEVPLWVTGSDAWMLTRQISDYQHTIQALGGYWSAFFTIRGNRHSADDWLQDGLGRHVEVYDHSLTKIWEGFVNKIVVNYGPLAVTRGPLLDAANSVAVAYSGIEWDEDDNPIVGTRVITAYADDTDSQAMWGIIPKILSTGGATETDAEAIRDTYLENHALPATGKEWRTDTEGEISVMVDCLGYVHWLNWAYNSTDTGEDDADVKLIDVLGDTPNSAWLTYNTGHVDSNAVQVPLWEDEDNIAWSVVKNIVARGGTSQERWLFGIYGNREAFYEAAPTTLEYQQRLSQSRYRIERTGGDEVYPWNVMPGKWLIFPDFLIGQAAELDLKDDPRAMFVEEVQYTAPWGLSLRGSTTDTTEALLAQLGLSGIGA